MHDTRTLSYVGRSVVLATRREAAAALRNSRGVSATFFALSLVAILGFVGLGTEAGMWYMTRRTTQNAADAAAVAGALATAFTGSTTADWHSSATSMAESNGFTDGVSGASVTVSFPGNAPGVQPIGGHPQVQATVQRTTLPLLASLFGVTSFNVGATATAELAPVFPVCALTLTASSLVNELVVNGTNVLSSCVLASNAGGATAIDIPGTLTAQSLSTAGLCSGCDSGNVTLTARPLAVYQPPTPDPYATAPTLATLQAMFQGQPCVSTLTAGPPADPNPSHTNQTIVLYPYDGSSPAAPSAHPIYCVDPNLDGQLAGVTTDLEFDLAWGGSTFVFYNSANQMSPNGSVSPNAFSIHGGTVYCNGCSATNGMSIVVAGDTIDQIGPVVIEQAASAPVPLVIALNTGPANALFSGLNGILLYSTANFNGPATINTTLVPSAFTNVDIAGAIYLPASSISFSGQNYSNCMPLVAGSVSLTNALFSVSQCPRFKIVTPWTLGASLVQ